MNIYHHKKEKYKTTVKMMVVVTNLVKKDNVDMRKAVEIYNSSVSKHNAGKSIKDYQRAVEYFLSNCYQADIIYEDR